MRHISMWALAAIAMVIWVPGCGDDDDDASTGSGQAVDDDNDDDVDDDADDDDTDDDATDDDVDDDADDDVDDDDEVPLPVTPDVLLDGEFGETEGLAFLPDGRMFVQGDDGVHEIFGDGTYATRATFVDPLGLAHDGDGNILVADYGDTSGFDFGDYEVDGSIVRMTPNGDKTTIATGIADPNFIAVRDDGSLLVSDDFVTDMFLVPAGGGAPSVFTDAIEAANGLVFSLDRSVLYVCQTFINAGGILPDRRIWSVALDENGDPGDVSLFVELPVGSAPDGAALDEEGRLYVAANLMGTIWRIDPAGPTVEKVADGMPFVASLAFSRGGEFPETTLYATQLVGGKIWSLDLGVAGAQLP
ncbi:MAG: SMP-30/gluconolactonase/LRE family protein [Deltaproteobacteria bacterium]|nr:SMP-30/gluconolactonase/LRE family protein [Deltaproteobacteria bacterium]